MPKGTPLTPEQKRVLTKSYTKSGNVAHAARKAGCSYAAAWAHLLGAKNDRRRFLHRVATERGEREAQADVRHTLDRIERVLVADVDTHLNQNAKIKIEPRDLANLARAQAYILGVLNRVKTSDLKADVRLADREDARRLARLARTRARLEIAKLEREARDHAGEGTGKIVSPDDPRWAEIQRELFGQERQGMHDARPHRDASPLAAK